MKVLFQLQRDPAGIRCKAHPAIKQFVPANRIQCPQELPCMVIESLIALFEMIQFLKHGYGNDNIMLFKMPDKGIFRLKNQTETLLKAIDEQL
jgi:hypothetical protein